MHVHRPLIEERFLDYSGLLRLIVSRQPWRLVVPMRGVSISEYGILADMDRRDFGEESSVDELQKIIRADFEYNLQLEGAAESAGSPIVQARLTGKEKTATGFRLRFDFVETSEDLEIFFEELVKAQTN